VNLKEISIEDARNLPEGHELWVGQTRQTARTAMRTGYNLFILSSGSRWILNGGAQQDFNLKFFIPTPDAVPIEPDEAAARMVRGEPVEYYENSRYKLLSDLLDFFQKWESDTRFRIPAIPQKQRLVIEVDAGVEVPDEFRIIGKENGWSITAAVKSRVVQDA